MGIYIDYLTIYDGPNDQSIQIEKLSGNLGSFDVSSKGNSLFIKFESQYDSNHKGFLATIHYGILLIWRCIYCTFDVKFNLNIILFS